MFSTIGMILVICVVLYFGFGLIICPTNYILKLYIPQYAWLVETLYYPIGMLQINFAKKATLTRMLEELNWEEQGHWAYNKYKNRIEERLHFLDNHSI